MYICILYIIIYNYIYIYSDCNIPRGNPTLVMMLLWSNCTPERARKGKLHSIEPVCDMYHRRTLSMQPSQHRMHRMSPCPQRPPISLPHHTPSHPCTRSWREQDGTIMSRTRQGLRPYPLPSPHPSPPALPPPPPPPLPTSATSHPVGAARSSCCPQTLDMFMR
jgi:hypothetical protein